MGKKEVPKFVFWGRQVGAFSVFWHGHTGGPFIFWGFWPFFRKFVGFRGWCNITPSSGKISGKDRPGVGWGCQGRWVTYSYYLYPYFILLHYCFGVASFDSIEPTLISTVHILRQTPYIHHKSESDPNKYNLHLCRMLVVVWWIGVRGML